ncbi:hypothetical protein [Heyndrickxia coagulans]|uniref:hypothetical protein n=1 Tax=Heyndrickxia coagulans TaxID=1398 RepID=UPI001452351D|nr:hypothetical protein [Heyndrickxia coagulans]MED4492831.1 hypothetical protein [Heyndrickxia coagulans]MED4535010.1 hypothetical protein [Heyndrickxia coagulans]QJE31803.1 hypothetical protein HHU11_03545 [Heyndrickxia coagulans]
MEITMTDGTTREVDINVNALTLFKLQKEGVINGNFLKGFMKEDIDLDPISVLQAIYAAYRQANKEDYLKFDAFLESYELDIENDLAIYFAVISKKAKKQFQKGFYAKTGASTGKK